MVSYVEQLLPRSDSRGLAFCTSWLIVSIRKQTDLTYPMRRDGMAHCQRAWYMEGVLCGQGKKREYGI
jgi:hypothetical protein